MQNTSYASTWFFPLGGMNFQAKTTPQCAWKEVWVIPFSQLTKCLHLSGSIPPWRSSFFDDVMHAVNNLQARSKFSWFNLLKSNCNGLLSMPCAFQQHPALFRLKQFHTFTPGSQTVKLQCKDSALSILSAACGSWKPLNGPQQLLLQS